MATNSATAGFTGILPWGKYAGSTRGEGRNSAISAPQLLMVLGVLGAIVGCVGYGTLRWGEKIRDSTREQAPFWAMGAVACLAICVFC